MNAFVQVQLGCCPRLRVAWDLMRQQCGNPKMETMGDSGLGSSSASKSPEDPMKAVSSPNFAEDMLIAVRHAAQAVAGAISQGAVATVDTIGKSAEAAVIATVSTATTIASGGRDIVVPVSDDEVNAPTPIDRWFTPAAGWTCKPVLRAGESKATPTPPLLMPRDYPAIAPEETLGILEVEVLEAENLPNKDIMGSTDAYAVLLLEGVAARSSAVQDSLSPRWAAASSCRAFQLPVSHASSCLYLSLFDFDEANMFEDLLNMGESNLISNTASKALGAIALDQIGDDPVGRVTLPLSALVSGVQYDAWLPLALNRLTDQPGQHGFVRLRYTLRITSSRARMLSYLSAPPLHVIPFTREEYRQLGLFATSDVCRASEGYDYQVLKARLNELRGYLGQLGAAIAAVEHVLLWRPGVRWGSLALLVGWQLVLMRPRYLPAALCCLGLQGMNATYRAADRTLSAGEDGEAETAFVPLYRKPIHKPRFWRLLGSLVRPGLAEIPLAEVAAAEAVGKVSATVTRTRYEDTVAPALITDDYQLGVRHWQRMLNPPMYSLDGKEVYERELSKRATDQLAILMRVEQQIDLADDTIEERHYKAQKARERDVKTISVNLINPLAPLLGSFEAKLLDALHPLRGLIKLVTWNDRWLTTWFYLGLGFVTFANIFVPWPKVVLYGLRTFGLVAFGPHMLLVGRSVDRDRRAEREAERAYRAANADERAAILAVFEQKLIAEAHIRVAHAHKAHAKRSAHTLASGRFLDAHPELKPFVLHDWRMAGHLGAVTKPDPARSTARLAPPGVALGGGAPAVDWVGHEKTD